MPYFYIVNRASYGPEIDRYEVVVGVEEGKFIFAEVFFDKPKEENKKAVVHDPSSEVSKNKQNFFDECYCYPKL